MTSPTRLKHELSSGPKTIQDLATVTGCGYQMVRLGLARLVELGEAERVPRPGKTKPIFVYRIRRL
jgi:predicted ArsR family transcriptional regulator